MWPKHVYKPYDVLFVEKCLFVAAARSVGVQTIVRRIPLRLLCSVLLGFHGILGEGEVANRSVSDAMGIVTLKCRDKSIWLFLIMNPFLRPTVDMT